MPETPAEDRSVLEQLKDQRSQLFTEAASAVEARRKERDEFTAREKTDDKPSDEDRKAFDDAEAGFGAAHDQRMAEVRTLDKRIDEEELLERRREDATRASQRERVEVTKEPLTYERGNGNSYFKDLAIFQLPGARSHLGDTGSNERLEKHATEMRVEYPKIIEQRDREARSAIDRAEHETTRELAGPLGIRARGVEDNPFIGSPIEQRVNPNRLDGQGGFFVPPLWLPEFIKALRAGRTTADLCRQMPLPTGTDSINLPKIKEPTEVAPQTQDAAPVASKDWTDTSVQANVKTLAGQSDVAIQLLEQSPYHLDEVIMEDLIADLNRKVDREVIAAPGTNTGALNAGLIKGLYPSSNWESNTLTWTEGTPLPQAFNQAAGAAISQIASTRFSTQNVHVVVHPRRWYWFATGLDGASGTAGRPMVSVDGFGPYNAEALYAGLANPAEGLVAKLPYGPHNIYIDANIPTKDSSGTPGAGAADIILAAKFDDAWLFEGDLRTRALSEVLSGTLEIRFQVFEYYAFLVRYGQSIAQVTGTGLAAPKSALASSIEYTSTVYAPTV